MKQVLSVADFSIIMVLVNREISQMEYDTRRYLFCDDIKDKKVIEEKQRALKENPYYKSLIHLKESLENLNVEVETADVEIKESIK